MQRNKVDFPDPEGPITRHNSPSGICRFTPLSAGWFAPGYVKDRSVMLIMDYQYITVKNEKDTVHKTCPSLVINF
jgi:hypothetical protein